MLYIMRHGMTEWNALHKLQGRTDIPLCDAGRLMAQNARDEYKKVNIDICFSSPLCRALETAQIFLDDRNIPIITDERLVEMSFGEYEGLENSFQHTECPINVIFKEPEKYVESVAGAETFESLYLRTGEFLRDKVEPQLQAGKDVLIVGHGAMNSSIVCQVKNIPIESFWSTGLEQCKLLQIK